MLYIVHNTYIRPVWYHRARRRFVLVKKAIKLHKENK